MHNFSLAEKILLVGLLSMIVSSVMLSCTKQPNQTPSPTIPIAATSLNTSTLIPSQSEPDIAQSVTPIPPSPTTNPIKLSPTQVTQTLIPTPVDFSQEMLTLFSEDRALTELRKLTGEESICISSECFIITTRKTGSEGLNKIKAYIANELSNIGYSVEMKDWSLSVYSDQNLIATRQGTTYPDEKIYFVAHMDAVAKNNFLRYPGADDNAGGIAAIMELARILSSFSLNRTVVLFLSTGEEQSALGVKSYLKQISTAELNSIKAVINIDMIGYDADNDTVMQLFHGDHPGSVDLANTIYIGMQEHQLKLKPQITAGCGWGDEGPFREMGIPTVLLIEYYDNGEPNPYRHSAKDTIAHMNLNYWFEQIKTVIVVAAKLAEPNR